MKHIRSRFIYFSLTFFGVGILAGAPLVAAETTTNSSADNATASNTTEPTFHPLTPQSNSTETSGEVQSLQVQANHLLEQERGSQKSQTNERQRQQACESHQTDINRKLNGLYTKASSQLTSFNNIFTKVQNLQNTEQLNVPNYSTLVANATAAGTTATTAVNALKTVDVNIDCSVPDPGSSLQTVKTALDTARDDLQTYRQNIREVITALENAKDQSSSTTKTSNTTEAQ